MRTGRQLLGGVTVPMVTPMDRPGHPCATEAASLLAALHGAGADALMLYGSNGEGPLLTAESLGRFAADAASTWRGLGGARPILINVTAAGTAEALRRSRVVASATPDALVLSPPIYFHHTEAEVAAHFASFSGLGVPVIAYNAPRYSAPLSLAVCERLMDMEHVVGIKDSSGEAALLRDLVDTARTRRPDFGVSQGAEQHLAHALRDGAHGVVPGIANIAPGPVVELFRSHTDGDPDSAERLQSVIDDLCRLHRVRAGVPSIKEVLSWRELCPPHVAYPLLPCTDDERSDLHAHLDRLEAHLLSR